MSKTKILFFLAVFFLGLFSLAKASQAATVYLDISATGCTGGGAANTNYNPATRSCGSGTDKVYAGNYPWEASRSLQNGDTLYIRAGQYYENITGKPGYMWFNGTVYISASNVTVKPYNSETVILSADASLTTPANSKNNPLAFYGSNILIDGLTIYGCVIFMGSNNIMQNCNLSGGWDHQDPIWNDTPNGAWPDVIRFYGSTNALVRNCTLHNNVMPPPAGDSCNMGLIMHDQDVNTIVENCSFYNAVGNAACIKYQHNPGLIQATYRYNIFDSSIKGIDGILSTMDSYIYQNIFMGSHGAGYTFIMDQLGTHIYIYNNTYYNVGTGLFDWISTSSEHQFFNNIFYVDSGTQYAIDYRQLSSNAGYQNYNDYYSTGSGAIRWGLNNTTYSSLTSWQGTGKDANSTTSNPNFINGSGNFSKATDFKRTSYPQNGRGGSWPSVIGAYIAGNEIIGLTSGGALDAIPPAVSISSPTSGSTISGTITISADASDNIGVAGVQFKLDSANLGSEDTSSPYSISWNTAGTSNDSHSLTATARDAAGNETTSSVVSITVDNADITPPAAPTGLSVQ